MTPERVHAVYESLGKLVIELDPDPTSRGYKYLQDLIATTRGYLNETSHYLSEVLRARHQTELELQAEESAFEVSADELLARDRRVSTLPNIDDRKAMINVLLGNDRRKIQLLKLSLKNLGHVEKVVRHRHKELESTMSAIRLQRSLVETESRTGSFYGDEGEGSRGTKTPAPDFDDEELQRMFDEAAVELSKPVQAEPVEVEAPAQESAPAPIPKSKDDFEDLLTNLDEDKKPEPPPVVVQASVKPKMKDSTADAEDPDIAKFLDGDFDFEGIFDSV